MQTYTERHSGTAIVCGAAACLLDDLSRARAMRPDATLLGCNMVPSLVPEIKHVWAQDVALCGSLIRASIPSDVKIHTSALPRSGFEAVYEADYIWPELDWVCGTSGFSAGLWARHGLGFDEVILAGVPLSKSVAGYADGYPSPGNMGKDVPAFGYEDKNFNQWLQHVLTHQRNGKTHGIYSMSGETMNVLGHPKE